MIRAFRAELVKLGRPRNLAILGGVAAALAAFGAALAVATAKAAPPGQQDGPIGGTDLTALAQASGVTAGFGAVIGFIGLLVFVVAVADVAGEFGRGTIRPMLVAEPRRARLLAGKVLALIVFIAGLLVVALLAAVAATVVVASIRDLPIGEWASLDAVSHALVVLVRAIGGAAGYVVLGAALGILVRSVAIALAVGFAWIFPLEHLIQQSWSPAGRIFPGLSLDAVVAGGSAELSAVGAVALATAWIVAAAAVSAVAFSRRDVTA